MAIITPRTKKQRKTIFSVVAVERARRSLVQVIRDDLDEREQYIIINHFELGALQKLKQMLSIEEFELLMS